MNNDSLSAELRALARVEIGDKTKKKAVRLRAVLPEVETALAAGSTHAQVLEKLNAHGLDMNLAVFNKTLSRLRAAKGNAGQAAAPAPAAKAMPKPEAPAPARAAARDQLMPDLGNGREPEDMDSLIKHGQRNKS